MLERFQQDFPGVLRQRKRNTLSSLSNRPWPVASSQARFGAQKAPVVCRLDRLDGLDAHAHRGCYGKVEGRSVSQAQESGITSRRAHLGFYSSWPAVLAR